MANHRASFTQKDLTRVLKSYRDVGLPSPQIVIEPQRIILSPTADLNNQYEANPWDEA